MKITTVRIPEELDRQLTEYANKEELSKNQVIKKAIRNIVQNQSLLEKDTKMGKKRCYKVWIFITNEGSRGICHILRKE